MTSSGQSPDRLTAWPLTVRAQQPAGLRRVGLPMAFDENHPEPKAGFPGSRRGSATKSIVAFLLELVLHGFGRRTRQPFDPIGLRVGLPFKPQGVLA